MKQKYNHWSKNEIQILKRIYAKRNFNEICSIIKNHTPNSIQSMSKKLKLKKPDGKRKSDLSKLLDDKCESFYWIGFIFADGCVSNQYGRVILNTVDEDKMHLLKFSKYIKSNMNRVDYDGSNYTQKPYTAYSVCVQHPEIVNKIVEKFDFKKKKTYNPPDTKILNKILNTKKKFMSFFLGFADGDGSITLRKNTFQFKISNYRSWECVYDYFLEKLMEYGFCNKKYKISNDREYVYFYLSNPILEKIKKYVNTLDIPLLQRKWKKIKIS